MCCVYLNIANKENMVSDLCYIQALTGLVKYFAVLVVCNIMEVLLYVRETLRYCHK